MVFQIKNYITWQLFLEPELSKPLARLCTELALGTTGGRQSHHGQIQQPCVPVNESSSNGVRDILPQLLIFQLQGHLEEAAEASF